MKQFTQNDVENNRIYCEESDLAYLPLNWQIQGKQQTVSGYGARITSRFKIHFEGELYRPHTTIYSNAGTTWFMVKGKKIIVN